MVIAPTKIDTLDAIGIIPKSRSQGESDSSLSLVTGSESAKAAKCDTSTFKVKV
ncbi:hypothetical protein M378DRAFT_169321 [Amanita muscaria Koide BX008]|uniref:Uncharacterized protein n=1 Tax=Amanita muscaria (strain Koide BX008) TaxID=946122 RepID=A0A0C2WRM2_AMAMK|nr:hypothetical protein M378DRAFT_169321 [Amanita muscaria Koide BX008]